MISSEPRYRVASFSRVSIISLPFQVESDLSHFIHPPPHGRGVEDESPMEATLLMIPCCFYPFYSST